MIYFCSEQWLKDNKIVTQNVDINDILPNVKFCADAYTRRILGTYFYNYLLGVFNAGTATSDELNLIDVYIKPAIAWRALSESYITMSGQLKNKGPQTQNGDFSEAVDFKSMAFISHGYEKRADMYDNILFDWLRDHKSLFSNFTIDDNDDSTIKKCGGEGNFNKNIFFIGGPRGNCCDGFHS